MKKWMHQMMASVTLVAGLGLQGYTQTDKAAKSLLDNVSQTYATYKTIQAEFLLDIKQAQQANHVESGISYMDKPTGKYHITMNDQEIISDGKTQWIILKDINEVQITSVDHSSDAISPTNIFSFYKNGYKYVSADDEHAGGRQLAVVELTPEDTNAPYFKIKLRVDKKMYQIHDVTIFDKGGNRFTYTIKSVKANPKLDDSKFTFKAADYPGVEIVDLR